MLTATSGFKTAIKGNAPYSIGKVDLINSGGTINFTADDIIKFDITGSAIKYDKVLGNIAQHSLTMELHGDQTADIDLALENRLQPFIGVKVGVAYEYIQQQDFIVVECSYSDTSDITKIVATDYLVKLNKEFVDTISYPVTLLVYAQTVATYCGLTLENSSFFNSDFSVTAQPFPDLTSCKEIFTRIAEMALCFVAINKTNNKIELKTAFELPTTADETITKDHYYDLKLNDHNFGTLGVNTLVLKISQVEGENTTVENATNVAIDGAVEIVIEDNPFINTQALRESVDAEMFAEIDEYIFQPYTINYRGYPYLELGDIVEITKMDNSTIKVPIFDMTISYNGGLKGTIKAKTLSKSQTSYKFISNSEQRIRGAEIMVDKVNGEVTILAGSKEDVFYKQITAPFTNSVTNGGYDSGTTDWTAASSTISATGGELTQIATAVNGNTNQAYSFTTGHIYYMAVYGKHDYAVTHRLYDGVTFFVIMTATANSTYTWYSAIGTCGNTATGVVQISRDGRASAWTTQYTKDVIVIDLTTLYGAGLEPTLAEFEIVLKRTWLDTSTNSYKSFNGSGWIPSSQLTGAKYVFDGTNATFYNGGLIIKNNAGTTVFTATTGGDVQITGEMMVGSTSVNAGLSGSGTASTSVRIWAGYATPSTSADFYVRDDGYMKANKGAIAGWTIASTYISKGGIKLDSANERIYVNTSAYLYAGATSTTIYANGGFIASGQVKCSDFISTTGITAQGAYGAGYDSIIDTELVLRFSNGGTRYILTRDASGFVKATTTY